MKEYWSQALVTKKMFLCPKFKQNKNFQVKE